MGGMRWLMREVKSGERVARVLTSGLFLITSSNGIVAPTRNRVLLSRRFCDDEEEDPLQSGYPQVPRTVPTRIKWSCLRVPFLLSILLKR